MRKNLLIATLIGLGVIGVTACSKGEENKNNDQTTQVTASVPQQNTDAPIQQPAPAADSAANNQPAMQPAMPAAPADASQAMAATGDTTNQQMPAPAAGDTSNTNGATNDNSSTAMTPNMSDNSSTGTPPINNSMGDSSTSNAASTDSSTPNN